MKRIATGTIGVVGKTWTLDDEKVLQVIPVVIHWTETISPWNHLVDNIKRREFTGVGPISCGTSLKSLFRHLSQVKIIV